MDCNKAKLIFIHEVGMTAASWNKLINALEADKELSKQFEVYKFPYSAPWVENGRSLEETGCDLMDWLADEHLYESGCRSVLNATDPITFICHGQGGLVLFHALRQYIDQNSRGGHNSFLRRIRQIILFSTPLTTAAALDEIEEKLPPRQGIIKGQNRGDFLRHLERDIWEGLDFYNQIIISADDYFPNELPIASLLFYGDKDLGGLNLPLWFPKDAAKRIPGDSHTLIQFDAQGAAYPKLKGYLQNPIGHANSFEIDQMQMQLAVKPLPSGYTTIRYGSHARQIIAENEGMHIKTVRFSKNNICLKPFTLRYATMAPGGGIMAEYAPLNAQIANREKINLYEKEGREFTFDFFPVANPNQEFRLTVLVYKGFDGVENQSTHFHLGNGKNYIKHLKISLDLSSFGEGSYDFKKVPEMYLFEEDNHLCADTPRYRMPEYLNPAIRRDDAGRQWEWELFDIRSGVIDLAWEVVRFKEPKYPKPKDIERTIKIFLASSYELRDEREAFQQLINSENTRLANQGIWLDLIKWEHEPDKLSHTRLQDEYNKRIYECDLFVGLFFTKAGEFTLEELSIARKLFEKKHKPEIRFYFREEMMSSRVMASKGGQALSDLIRELQDAGHFITHFTNIPQLKELFSEQIDLFLQPEGGTS